MTPLQRTVLREYGLATRELAPLPGGLDASASVYLAATDDGSKYVIKVVSMLRHEVSLPSWLAKSGVGEAAAPIPTLESELASELDGKYILVYRFIEGHNGFEKPLAAGHWRNLGSALSKIHRSVLPPEIKQLLKVEKFHTEGEAEFHSLVRRLNTSVSLSQGESALREVLVAHEPEIRTVLTRCRELGQLCALKEWPLVPCHADIHVGNVLAEESGAIHIVDWDSPRMAPIECDLMFFVGGGITGHGELEEQSFLEGYGPVTLDPLPLTYYRFARAMEDIVSFARESLNPENSEALRFLKGLFKPGMIVETAMSSDDF